ncbi:hypothetical protein PGH51_11105 [Klebsiella pneumoniae]|nr:hypothetical protein [Klebsiella pneumoniae]MDA5066506.1 hypothetical protein [Klebsiella pneumoniae]
MNDITELAQREKFEAWFKSSFHPDKTGPYIKDQLYFAWKAAGAELVEALEKAQQCITELKSGKVGNALLERENHHVEVVGKLTERIAKLESRTVKLPDLRQIVSGDRYVWSDGVYNYSQDVKVALAAAGIKVEAE